MYAKKSLGQNFLTSTHIVDEIAAASLAQKGDTVLEIGPGKGILTRALLKTGAAVVVIEKDDRLIPILEETFADEVRNKKLTIIHGDILECDVSTIISTPYKVVANIPYYITGQIIRMFLESDVQPTSMTLLVQKEVAERIIARDKKESLLSLSIKAYGEPRYIRTVSRGAFNPSPNVDSAVIHIATISKKNFKDISEKDFFAILHAGFAHKRKQLVPNLSSLYSKDTLASAFEKLNLDPKSRAEDVSLEIWLRLSVLLTSSIG